MTVDPPDDRAEPSRVTLRAWLVTDVGVVRPGNEDAAFMAPERGYFIVADGMGGHAHGEIASAMAVDTVRQALDDARDEIEAFTKAPTDAGRRDIVQLLQSAVVSAHRAVFERGQAEADMHGMGTTLDVVLVAGPEAFVAHVGDSRTYLIRDGRPAQVTTDHTVTEVWILEGKLTVEEAQVSPYRTVLVNAIGVSEEVGVELQHVMLERGDRLLLCSDGLHDYFPVDDEIGERLGAEAVGDALTEMVELAKSRGGHDNITGIAVEILDVDDHGAHVADSTQPVEIPTDVFAADEPTETAGAAVTSTPPQVPDSSDVGPMRATTPMRALSEDGVERPSMRPSDRALGSAETIPPPVAAARVGAVSEPAGDAAVEPAGAPADDAAVAATDDTSTDDRSDTEAARATGTDDTGQIEVSGHRDKDAG